MRRARVMLVAAAVGMLWAGVVRADEAGVRKRLVDAAAATKKLRGEAAALPGNMEETLGLQAAVPEDGAAGNLGHPRESAVEAYAAARPWADVWTRQLKGKPAEAWPAAGDAGALRGLLKDKDGEVRSLAVEALASLDLPEDVPVLAGMVGDDAAGVVVLSQNRQMNSMGFFSRDTDAVEAGWTWHPRTVGTYAREALKRMTGHRFDGKDPAGVTFEAWWKTHDLGRAALWYWQTRLTREEQAQQERKGGAAERAATMKEIMALPMDTRVKIFLMTTDGAEEGQETVGVVNGFFPGGLKLEISQERWAELVAGKTGWADAGDVEFWRQELLWRMARIADEVTRGYPDAAGAKAALAAAMEKDAPQSRWRAVLVSRLLPAAGKGDSLDDAKFREGYLRQALAGAKDEYERENLAREMVDENVAGQWEVLKKVFATENGESGSDARTGILRGLGDAPATQAKARRLAELLDDPANEKLFTQENRTMGMDMYRHWAIASVNAIAGKEAVGQAVQEGLPQADRRSGALAALRKSARGLVKGE